MAIKGYWRLNGNSNDASGNGNNGTDTATTYSQAEGKVNQGALFNGTTSIIKFATMPRPSGAAITVATWLKTTHSSTVDEKPIIGGDDSIYGSIQRSFQLIKNTDATNHARFLVFNASTLGYSVGTKQINDGKWHFIVGTYDGSYVRLYVDGILDGTPAALTGNIRSGTGIGIGQYSDETSAASNSFFNGSIDESIIDDSIWTPAKIKNEYSRVKGFFS